MHRHTRLPAVGEEECFFGTLIRLDIADFSSRPDRLAREGGRGLERDAAEDLATAVEDAFRPIFYAVDRHGGSIAGLEGDAVLALFRGPEHDRRARRAMAEVRAVRPGLHVAIATGEVRALQLGGGEQRAELLHGPALLALERVEKDAAAFAVGLEASSPGGQTLAATEDAALCKFIPPALRDLAPQPPAHRRIVAVFLSAPLASAVPVYRALAEEAEAHHVVLLKVRAEGDELVAFALAGAPTAAGDDGRRAFAFALACRNRLVDGAGVRVRFGVAEGPVLSLVLGDGARLSWDVLGDCVNVAYRLLGQSSATDILATSALVEAAITIHAGPVETVQLRGKTRPTPVRRVLGLLSPSRHTPDLTYPRTRELERIQGALEAGLPVVVVGAAGQGKRYLWQEWAARNGDWRVVRATCRNHGAVRPLAPFIGTIRRLGGEAPTHQALQAALRELPEMDDRSTGVLAAFVASGAPQLPAVVAAVRQLLFGLAAAGPTLLVVEDVQWADDDATGLIQRLVTEAPRSGLRVLVTARPRTRLPEGAEIVEIGPLSRQDAERLVLPHLGERAADPELVAEVIRRGNGIPRELVALANAARRGTDQLPESMEVWYAVRLDALDPSAREVLERAAILGRTLNQGLLRRLSADVPRAEEGLRTLYDQRLLVTDDLGTRVAFDREATREIVYMRMTSARRRQLHTRVGRVLQGRADSGVPVAPEVLAWHLSRSDTPADAIGPLVEAARRALAHGRPKLALAHSEQATRIARQHDVGSLPHVQRALGDAMLALGRADLALEAFRNVGDTALTGEVAAALVAAGFAREALEAVGDQQGAMACAVRARALSLLSDPGAEAAHALAIQAAGNPGEHARALRFYGADLIRHDRFEEALPVLREAVKAAKLVGDPSGKADAQDLLGGVHAAIGDLSAALVYHRTALALRDMGGRPEEVAGTLRRLGRTEARTAHAGRALGHLLAARALMREAGLESRLSRVEVDLAEVRLRRGERAHAQRHLDAATDLTGRARARHALLSALAAEPADRPVATARAIELADLDRWRSGKLLATAYAAWQDQDEALLASILADLKAMRHAEFATLVEGWRGRPPPRGTEDVIPRPT